MSKRQYKGGPNVWLGKEAHREPGLSHKDRMTRRKKARDLRRPGILVVHKKS